MTSQPDDLASLSDDEIRARIATLEAQLHHLRDAATAAATGDADAEREVQRQNDQLWDPLRQRNARRESGQCSTALTLRPASEVDGYLQ